jgi:hypothetical protein
MTQSSAPAQRRPIRSEKPPGKVARYPTKEETMSKLTNALLGAVAIGATLAGAPALAQQPKAINLTVASSHPTTIAWVGGIQSHFQPEVNKCLAGKGNKFTVNWKEAYGGQLYKANATLTSVGEGITDVGWVFIGMEPSKLPLMQLGAVTPFVTDDLPAMMEAVNKAHDQVPGPAQAVAGQQRRLPRRVRQRQLRPVPEAADQIGRGSPGRRLTAPQSLSLWLLGTGAALKEGGLTDLLH